MSRRRDNDHVIHFTPEPGFTIEGMASAIVQMMRDMDMGAHVSLPDGVVIEIDKDCTVSEIVGGYKDFMAEKMRATVPSNRNEKEPEPVK